MAKPDTDRSSPSAKRKLEDSDSDSDVGPQLPSTKQDAPAKRAKTIGPAMPPPGMIPQAGDCSSTSSDDEDDDDDYGPSLPPPPGASQTSTSTRPDTISISTTSAEPSVSSSTTSKVARDDWMLRPPDELDLSSRVDPTKLRNRKFNTAPSGRSGAGGGGASGPSKMWTETPEEKRRRLENEVMGIQAPAAAAAAGGAGKQKVMSEEEVKRARMVQEYNDKRRNKSLYAQHKEGKKGEDEKDDPSARAFDKEKDIRAPSKITNAQRREMVNKASNFSSRFSGGNFL